MKEKLADPFDYPLRSPKEIREEQRIDPPTFPITVIGKVYAMGDKRYEDNKDTRSSVAKFTINLHELKLTPLQKQRFIFLLGPRYNPKSDVVKFVCRQYNTYNENMIKALEQCKMVYWESLRAPRTNVTLERSPAMRFWARRKLGRTLEERKLRVKELKREREEHVAKREREIVEE